MTSVAARLGRKKKLIYLSRGNCLGAVSGHESSLRSLFLSDRPDEGHLTIVITSMDWPAHQALPATYLNSQLSAVSSATTANAFIATTQKYFSTEVLLMKWIGTRNKWIGNENLEIWQFGIRFSSPLTLRPHPCSSDDWRVWVYTVYNVYSWEHRSILI